jgi:hypothetical protein
MTIPGASSGMKCPHGRKQFHRHRRCVAPARASEDRIDAAVGGAVEKQHRRRQVGASV